MRRWARQLWWSGWSRKATSSAKAEEAPAAAAPASISSGIAKPDFALRHHLAGPQPGQRSPEDDLVLRPLLGEVAQLHERPGEAVADAAHLPGGKDEATVLAGGSHQREVHGALGPLPLLGLQTDEAIERHPYLLPVAVINGRKVQLADVLESLRRFVFAQVVIAEDVDAG